VTPDQWIALLVLTGALALFVTEALPLGVTGLCIIATLGLTGVLDAQEAVRAFSSPAVVLVGSLYVVSASLIRTGVVAALGTRMLRAGGGSEARLMIVATLAATLVSSLLNNTSVVVMMIPILLGAASKLNIPPSRLLMPVSFASILGGMTTLIGTSTNVLVADLAAKALPDEPELGFFEFLPAGLGFVGIGLAYLWIVARRILPSRQTVSSVTRGRAFEYVTELRVPQRSRAVGMTPARLVAAAGAEVRVLQVVHGEEIIDARAVDRALVRNDIVVLRGSPEAIVALRVDLQLVALPHASSEDIPTPRGSTFAEIVVTPASVLMGNTLAEIGLHRELGVTPVALQRRGSHLRHGITKLPLHAGDVILVEGSPDAVERLRHRPGLLLLIGVDEKVPLRRRAPVAIAILALFVVLAASRVVPIPLLAVAAAVACLATGCISMTRSVREINWDVLGLLAGVITLGSALTETGLAAEAAHVLVGLTRDLGPIAVLSTIYLLATVATEFVSNAGAAAVILPIAVATSQELGVDPRAFVFAVAFGASASFSTPIGYQTNAFIYGPGGYRFRDYLRVGLPLQVILWVYASVALPFFFPM